MGTWAGHRSIGKGPSGGLGSVRYSICVYVVWYGLVCGWVVVRSSEAVEAPWGWCLWEGGWWMGGGFVSCWFGVFGGWAGW